MEKMNVTPGDPPPEGHGSVEGLGVTQEATPGRQRYAQAELDRLYQYHVKAGTHVWLMLLTHHATDKMLDGHDGTLRGDTSDMMILDVESMIGLPTLVCYVCEAAYEPRLRRRKCPGDPNPELKS